jgi:hypothetical protein
MRVSQQIGWSQESKLIFELIKETEKLNTLLPGSQPSYNVNVSKQIGWSNESNLYYEWLNSLSKLTAHSSNCCTPTTTTTTSSSTTTTTTTAPPGPNLSLKIDNSPNFDIPDSHDFTIEWFAKMTDDVPHPRIWSVGSWPDAAHAVSIESGQFYYWINGAIVLSRDISSYGYIGNWTHFCVMRWTDIFTSNQSISLYVNGISVTNDAITSAIPTNGYPLYLGSEGNDSLMNGLLSNFRWTNTAVYDGTGFTPPTSPLTTISGTQLLIFQGDSLPLEITDNSGNGYTITNGTGVYNADNPFGGYAGSIQFGTI